MLTTTETRLQELRPGDRVKYYGMRWDVKDYGTYHDDSQGYETTEWLLRSPTGKEYYLIREVDPQNPELPVNWYLAEELVSPSIFKPNSTRNLLLKIWVDIRRRKTPYPELHVLNRVYYFESQTEGGYGNNKRKVSRITWDYWDAAHQWNLAIEALLNQELHVYSTKPVRPEKFSNFEKRLIYPEDRASSSTFPSRILQFWGAGCLVIIGLLMIIFG